MLPIVFSLAALAAGTQAQAIDLPQDRITTFVQETGLLRFPLKSNKGVQSAKGLSKRQNNVGLEPKTQGTLYTIDLELGTPPQTVSVQFDTGSSELWVNPDCSAANDPQLCKSSGHFDNSSSLVDTGRSGGVQYGKGWAEFEYVYDYVGVGAARISQQIFGVATDSSYVPVGLMGAGPDLNGWDNSYPLILDNLVRQGYIDSRAFSMDLRSLEDDRGAAIFGGIDTKKYSGHLERLPIVPAEDSPDQMTRYWVRLNGISVSLANGDDVSVFEDGSQTVLLDSGYTISTLPGPIFNQLVKAFPSAKPIDNSDYYSVDCSLADTEGTVDFTFGETTINVPYADWIWQQPEGCFLGAYRDDEMAVLGDTFLRAAYVVYDWDNRNIHIANNEDCGSNLVAIGSGPDAVPSIVGACGATPTETPTSIPSTTSTPPPTTTGPSTTSTPVTTPPPTHSHTTSGNATVSTSSKSTGWGNSTITSHPAPPPHTSVFSTTKTYTITSCSTTVTDCPVGHVTTETLTSTTTYCPETTGTVTLPTTYTCTRDVCNQPPPTQTGPVVVHPHPTNTVPVGVPGCHSCAPPPEVTSPPPAVTNPPPAITTATRPPSNVTATGGPSPPAPTAGASKMLAGSGTAALGIGALIAALL